MIRIKKLHWIWNGKKYQHECGPYCIIWMLGGDDLYYRGSLIEQFFHREDNPSFPRAQQRAVEHANKMLREGALI